MTRNRLWEYPLDVSDAVDRGSSMLRCPECGHSNFSMYLNPEGQRGFWIVCRECEHAEEWNDIERMINKQFFDWDMAEVRDRMADLNDRLQRVEAELFYDRD